MEDVPNHGMQAFPLLGQKLIQVKIKLGPVLDGAVAQPGGEGRVPAVQMVPFRVVL